MNQSLQKGTSIIQLKFDGKTINAYNINGPYKLLDLQIYNSSNTDISDWIPDAYTTKPYTYLEFEVSNIPAVISFTPEDGAQAVASNAGVKAVFTRDMNPQTIDTLSFYLTERSGRKVSSKVAYTSSDKTATLTPNSPLLSDSLYIATITRSAKDINGTALIKQYNWSFTVASTQIVSSDQINNVISYPNPFPHSSLPAGGMYFTYYLKNSGGKVTIKVYSITGDLVRNITENETTTRQGYNQVYWDGRNEGSNPVSNGSYVYILYYTDPVGTERKEIGKFTVLR